MKKSLVYSCFLVFVMLTVVGCSTISSFDQYAYAQVTSAKVDVLALMDNAVEPYSSRAEDIGEVTNQLLKIVEYEKHRPKNQITIKMWDILIKVDSTGNLDDNSIIPSFWKKWKKDGRESRIFIEEAKKQVGEGFDLIAELEAKKIKSNDIKISSFLSK